MQQDNCTSTGKNVKHDIKVCHFSNAKLFSYAVLNHKQTTCTSKIVD